MSIIYTGYIYFYFLIIKHISLSFYLNKNEYNKNNVMNKFPITNAETQFYKKLINLCL